MSREAAYSGLFTLLTGISAFARVSRVIQPLDAMNAADLPACFMRVTQQVVKVSQSVPPRRELRAAVYVYAASPDPTIASGIVLNNLIDAVELALAPPASGLTGQTLGGAVLHAWIEGTIDVYEAVKSQRAAALIPVRMMMP